MVSRATISGRSRAAPAGAVRSRDEDCWPVPEFTQRIPKTIAVPAKISAVLCRAGVVPPIGSIPRRSEEHTSELQSLMRISYAVFCLKKKTTNTIIECHKNAELSIPQQKNQRTEI